MTPLVGFGAIAVYAWLTPPVSGLGDGPEFTVGLATAGLVHPPGYPLYLLAGHPFVRSLHALGASWAWASNLWSGVGAALAVALTFAVARRLVSVDRRAEGLALLAALLPAALLAFNPVLSREAVEAEVNSWALAWTMGIVLCFVALMLRVEEGSAPRSTEAMGWGVVCGIGLAHHPMSVLVAVPLTAALGVSLARRGWLGPRLGLAALAGAMVPLAAYAWVGWRAAHPAPGQWRDIAPTWQSVWHHVTAARYRMYVGSFAPDLESRRLLAVGVYPYLLPGILLLVAAYGRAVRSPERRLLWLGLFAAAVAPALGARAYGVPDPAPYFLPAVGISLLGLAPLAGVLLRRGLPGAALLGTGLAAAMGLAWNEAFEARARYRDVEHFDRQVRDLWSQVPQDRVIVLWHADQVSRLVEYQVLRGERSAAWVGTPDWLLDPVVRGELRRRYGADPVAHLTVPRVSPRDPHAERIRMEFFEEAAFRLASEAGVPVYWFDPTVPLLRRVPQMGSATYP
ncbi:MAG TPA: DUF2723 domain-containing protein [Candidatus Eisenbacteria bacterium]|nr:DUF2723 domain-containing protein [Candidatus Eisenbacteria bacterium]